MSKCVTKLSALVFTFVCLMHAFRMIKGWPVIVAGYDIPQWVSGIVVVITGILAIGNWKAAITLCCQSPT